MEKQKKLGKKIKHINSYEKFYRRNNFKEVVRLLLNLYNGELETDNLKVDKLFSFFNNSLGNIQYYKNLETNLLDTDCYYVYAEIEYKGNNYFIYLYEDFKRNMGEPVYIITISFDSSVKIEEDIATVLKIKAIELVSEYKNSVCTITEDDNFANDIQVSKIKTTESINLENIFLPEKIKEEINMFIYTYNNFKRVNKSLRYLFSGKPGLGKTEIVRAIINKCKGNGNITIVRKITSFNLITEFVSYFQPSLICIDDIDLLVHSRERGSSNVLRGFLENLDGIIKNNIFILATTNDKKIVDIAASRPGRFDLIIDFPNLEKKYYLPLIKTCTKNNYIISLFNEKNLEFLYNYELTGSFIVNFIKQLNIISNYKGEINEDDFRTTFKRIYDGFYRSQIQNKEFGFNVNKNVS